MAKRWGRRGAVAGSGGGEQWRGVVAGIEGEEVGGARDRLRHGPGQGGRACTRFPAALCMSPVLCRVCCYGGRAYRCRHVPFAVNTSPRSSQHDPIAVPAAVDTSPQQYTRPVSAVEGAMCVEGRS
jgi:hypothetical protein